MLRNKKWDDSLPEKGTAAWEKASKPEKEEAITRATEFIDTLPFKGEHLRRTQALAWPRKGAFREDGAPIVGVPEEVEEATGVRVNWVGTGFQSHDACQWRPPTVKACYAK